MGGWGSGRQYGKPIAEHALRIDIAWMIRRGLARPGQYLSGNLSWTRGGEPSGNISYSANMCDPEGGTLELRFKVTRHNTGESKDYTQRIRLSYTEPHFGGKRWWMHCPVTGERVGKLYVPDGGDIFASRKAWRIGYRSQRVTERDAAFERLYRLQRKLGGREGWDEGYCRPKGMHRRTFERLEEIYWKLDQQCDLHMMHALAGFMPKRGVEFGV